MLLVMSLSSLFAPPDILTRTTFRMLLRSRCVQEKTLFTPLRAAALLIASLSLILLTSLPMRRKSRTSKPVCLALFFLSFASLASLYYYRLPSSGLHTSTGDYSYPFGTTFDKSDGIMTSTSLASTLNDKKKALLQRLSQPVNDASPFIIIMGNEAGDTDSLSSSILLSHLLSLSTSNPQAKKFSSSTTFVPLSQLPREDLKLRSENEMLLSIMNLTTSDLLFLDDLPSLDKMLRSDIQLGLTDHPQLSNFWQPYDKFSEKVQIVVDHHADDGAHKDAKLRVLRGPNNGAVGCAVSVVVDLFKDDKEIKELHSQLADLGLAAILIDTDDLRPTPRGKATSIDLHAANLLLTQSSFNSAERSAFIETAVKAGGQVAAEAVGQSPEEEDEMSIEASSVKSPKVLEAASAYYRILSAKKLDVTRLNTIDLLRRDYKENAIKLGEGGGGTSNLTAGFSSVPVGLSDWVHERHGNGKDRWDGYWGALRDWMKQKGLDVAVIGTSFREQVEEEGEKGKHKRELILAYRPKSSVLNLFPSLVKYLESDSYASEMGDEPSLQLNLDQPWKGWRRIQETGKKERIGSIEKDGRWTGDEEMKVAVWLQRNGRASRKVYLPAVVHALAKATKAK